MRDKYDEMTERLLPLITAFGNAEFGCGEWAAVDRAVCDKWKEYSDEARTALVKAVAAELRAQYVAGLVKAKEIAERLSSLGDKIIVVDWLLTEIDKEIGKAVLEDDENA